MITSGFCHKNELLEELTDFSEQNSLHSKEQIERELKPLLKSFIDDLTIYIEYPYVEKFYRDTYYHFYSKKFSSYDRNSIRISFFKKPIEESHFETATNFALVQKNFLGYITIRPTSHKIIGSSFVSPEILNHNDFVCCQTERKVLVLCYELSVKGFPYSAQDNEFITCSETSLLNLIYYFGLEYSEYSYLLPSHLNTILKKHTHERQLPSKGMQTEKISFALKKMGFDTVVYSFEDTFYTREELKNITYIYIESGLPFILNLKSVDNYHTVLVIGREKKPKPLAGQDTFTNRLSRGFKQAFVDKKDVNVDNFSTFFDNLIIMNDASPPYSCVPFNTPLMCPDTGKPYSPDSIIVPLFGKIHLEAFQLAKVFPKILKLIETFQFKKEEGEEEIKKPLVEDFLGDDNNSVVRPFLTTGRKYKSFLFSIDDNSKLVSFLIHKSMPKYIWVIEIIQKSNIKNERKLRGLFLIDATESGYYNHLISASNEEYTIIRSATEIKDKKSQTDYQPHGTYHYVEVGLKNICTFAIHKEKYHG